MNLVYDRTAQDVETARTQRGTTLTPLKGCYNITDLNRVESAVKTLAAALTSAGYPVKVEPVLKGSSRVPAGYTEVEYIESTGTQYIDTGILPGNTTQLVMDFEPTTLPASHVMAAGARNNSSGYTKQFVIGWAGHQSPAVWRSDFGGSQVSFPTSVEGAIRHHLDKDGAACTMDSTTVTNTSSTFTCAYTLYLFAGNQNDEAVSQVSMKLYVCRIYDNGTLVRNYIPCRNPDGEVGLYDLIGGEFYTTPLAEEPVALPSGYTQIAYLQSTGTQYIDSGVKGDSDVRVTADFEITAFGSGTTFVFGAQGTDSVRYTLGMTSAGAFRSDFGTAMTSGSAASLNTRYSADKNGNVCTVGGQTLTSAAATFSGTTNIYLFARSYSSISCSKIKMYRCKMYKAGTLVRDLVPARNSSGTLGLYDTVGGVFYTNQGSGAFTAGADIVGFTAGAEIGKAEDREWQEGDIVRRAQWTTYLDNVQKLRDAYYTLAETGELPAPEDKLKYTGANTIEKVLADIDLLLDGMKSIYRRAGTFTAGGSYTRQMIRSI